MRDTFWNAAIDLKKENEALKQRIRELESVVNDPEVLWTNWLRGTVKLPSGIGDVRQYQERIKRLEEAGDALYENSDLTRFDSLQAANRKLNAQEAWRKAKESKP